MSVREFSQSGSPSIKHIFVLEKPVEDFQVAGQQPDPSWLKAAGPF